MMLLVGRRPALVPANMINHMDIPTLFFQFDINQAAKNDYRIFYLQKIRKNKPCVRYRILDQHDNLDPVTSIWFVVTDLVQFYNDQYHGETSVTELEAKYNTFKNMYHDIYEELRSNGTIRVVNGIDYIQSPAFDIQCLRLINSPFAKRISEKLFPKALLDHMTNHRRHQQEDPRSNVHNQQQGGYKHNDEREDVHPPRTKGNITACITIILF